MRVSEADFPVVSYSKDAIRGYLSEGAQLEVVADKLLERNQCMIETESRIYDCSLPDPLNGEQIPYWYAFWEPPHPSGYGPEEFRRVNSVLFPKGTEELEVYEWTTDWSNYFEDGREWWGTACWSVYDPQMNRIAVIMAECTD